MNTNLPILHAFDPNRKFFPPKHGEVRFVQGRYIDIATTKGKDSNSLYFGKSQNSNLLTGIFLGDLELTSKVKDVSLKKENNNIVLEIKYVNEQGKLATVTSKLPSTASYQNLVNQITNLKTQINNVNSSINNLKNSINTINSSVYIIENRLDLIDTSINTLISDLDAGKYNYTIRESISSFEEGLRHTYTLFKGDDSQTDSSVITLNDYVLKKLEYDDETNTLIAYTWPEACDDIYQWEHIIDADGNEQDVKTAKLDDEFIKKIELNLDNIQSHIINVINTDSVINDRITYVENQLRWEELFTD